MSASGRRPFQDWVDSIKDKAARATVAARITRIRAGTWGDWKSVGDGVFELRIHSGPGYRVYFGRYDPTLVILLIGGDKRSQDADINKAKAYWKNYEAGTKAGAESPSL